MYSNKNLKALCKNVNADLKLVFTWLCANRLSVNVDKTEFIIFKPPKMSLPERITLKLNNVTIFESTKLCYLGLVLDDRLTWNHHIAELNEKLNRTIGIIYRLNVNFIHEAALKSIYFSLFQSHLNYSLCLGANRSDIL